MSSGKFQAPEIEELAPLFPAYEFVSLIAVGGMGAVYRAVQMSLEREVAVKVLPRVLGENMEFRHQFEEEAKAMAKMNHANLLGVIDFGTVDGMPFIIMEYVHGSSLHHAVGGQPVESHQTAEVMIQVASAIAHAHENGMLHRDIKPANILLDQNFTAKVADFGLAKQTNEELDESVIWGTPGYTAPEVMQGANNASVKSDIFALGGVIYFLLTAKTPDPNDIHLTKLVRCDPRFKNILLRCMHLDPSMRYKSSMELVADLKKLLPDLAKQSTVVSAPTAAPLMLGAGGVAVPTTAAATCPTSPTTMGGHTGVYTTGANPAVGAQQAPASYPSPVPQAKGKGISSMVIVAVFLLALVGIGYGVYYSMGDKPKDVVEEEVDYSVQLAAVPNASFENFKSDEKSGHEFEGWRSFRQSGDFTTSPVSSNKVKGSEGDHILMLRNGWMKTSTGLYAKKGYTYILEFSIASDGEGKLVANKDFKINIMLGSKVPAKFEIAEQLPVLGTGMARYKLSFDADRESPDFQEPLGIRIVATRCTLFVDDIELKYHRIKE